MLGPYTTRVTPEKEEMNPTISCKELEEITTP